MSDNGGGERKYSWREFLVPAADGHGHSERPQLRVPPDIMTQMMMFVNSGRFPYQNYQQLMRHALVRLFDWLHGLEPGVPSVTAQIKAMTEVLNRAKDQQDFYYVYEQTNQIIQRNAREGHPEADKENIRLLNTLLNAIHGMPNGYWKRKYLRIFKDKYHTLLQAAPGVKLTVFEDEEQV